MFSGPEVGAGGSRQREPRVSVSMYFEGQREVPWGRIGLPQSRALHVFWQRERKRKSKLESGAEGPGVLWRRWVFILGQERHCQLEDWGEKPSFIQTP